LVTEHPATMAAIFVQTTTPTDADQPNRNVAIGDIWLDTNVSPPALRKCTSVSPITFAGLIIVDGGTGLTANPTVEVPISAASLRGTITAGAGDSNQLPQTRELPTNLVNIDYIPFDQTTEENAHFQYSVPTGWNEGTITFRYKWTAAGGSVGETVVVGLKALARGNDDPLDAAWGSEITVSDALLAVDDEHISAESAALTVGGTVAEGDAIYFNIARKTGSDNLAADLQFKEIIVTFTRNSYTD